MSSTWLSIRSQELGAGRASVFGGCWAAPREDACSLSCVHVLSISALRPPFTSLDDPSNRASPPAMLTSPRTGSVGAGGAAMFLVTLRPVVGLRERPTPLSAGRCLVWIRGQGVPKAQRHPQTSLGWRLGLSFPPGGPSPTPAWPCLGVTALGRRSRLNDAQGQRGQGRTAWQSKIRVLQCACHPWSLGLCAQLSLAVRPGGSSGDRHPQQGEVPMGLDL